MLRYVSIVILFILISCVLILSMAWIHDPNVTLKQLWKELLDDIRHWK